MMPQWPHHGATLFDTLVAAGAAAAADATDANRGITLLPEREGAPEDHRSYARLLAEAERLAGALSAYGVRAGDRVLLVLPTSFDFVVAFFAIGRIGAVPVPSYPPAGLEGLELAIDRLAHVAGHAEAAWCVANRKLRSALGALALRVSSLRQIIAIDGSDVAGASEVPSAACTDLAFLQYTSGSTGRPKGVALSHTNVLSNIHAIGRAVLVTPNDRTVSWLPLYHDMGLIGGLLFSIAWRLPLVLMSPVAFLMRPWRWLRALSDHRGTLSPAPNFAYALTTKRAFEGDLEGVDLGAWRLALNGAEPIRHEHTLAFASAFAEYGFRETAIFPVYGLAEASLALTAPVPGEGPHSERFARDALLSGNAVVADEGSAAAVLTSVGRAVPDHEIRIADEEGRWLEDGRVGEVLARGPSVMRGYFRDPEATALAMRDGWLRTGDLGFVHGGLLFITGREKDLIIVDGRNHHAEDIERVAESVEGVRRGRCVAFSVEDETDGREVVVLVCERKDDAPQPAEEVADRIAESVRRTTSLVLDEVLFVPTGTLPKTSSGKLQRREARRRYLEATLLPREQTPASLARAFVRSAAGLVALVGRRAVRRR